MNDPKNYSALNDFSKTITYRNSIKLSVICYYIPTAFMQSLQTVHNGNFHLLKNRNKFLMETSKWLWSRQVFPEGDIGEEKRMDIASPTK